MKRISTQYTVHLKWASYVFWAVLLVVSLLLIANGGYELAPWLLVGMGIAAAFGVINYFNTKTIVRNLVDEVYDWGDSLLLRRGREEERIVLSNIANVTFTTEPSRIALKLTSPGKFGDEIAFVPPRRIYFGSVPQNPIADDLTTRAAKARSEKAFGARSFSSL